MIVAQCSVNTPRATEMGCRRSRLVGRKGFHMTTQFSEVDVVVVGGGFAGLTAARNSSGPAPRLSSSRPTIGWVVAPCRDVSQGMSWTSADSGYRLPNTTCSPWPTSWGSRRISSTSRASTSSTSGGGGPLQGRRGASP